MPSHNPNRREFLTSCVLGSAALALPDCVVPSGTGRRSGKPNVVILFSDDQGYADVGIFGAKGFSTPHCDRMAAEGVRFTDFYVAQPVCGASRAALLTGCYPNRIGLAGAPDHTARHGIHKKETTIAEMLKDKGYATAVFGKWHLGHREKFLPLQHGFDEYFGLPYSNDMHPAHPTSKNYYPPLPLMEGNKVVALDPDQSQLTKMYTERAVSFIERNRERPFFLYVPYAMPHVPLHVSDRHAGKSEQGLFGDVIMEIDWSVGRILETLKREGLDEDTLVIFTSDNGPWLSYGNHAGSAGPLREGKGTVFEGGVREPCIMRWPGTIPAGTVCREPAMTIDLLPTIAGVTGAALPPLPIDGKDIFPLMCGTPDAGSPHEALYFYYRKNDLQALRSGDWKLIFPHKDRSLTGTVGRDGMPGGYTYPEAGLELYNLRDDVGETRDVAADHPDIVARLQALAEKARDDLGDRLTGRKGKNLRAAGRVEKVK